MTELLTLGIETSCDETAAAVYSSTRGILSNKLFSQIELHKEYGGVVPEIASRSHIEKINTIINEALAHAQVTLADIEVIAVTNKPGLAGSLLVGVCFAKGLAYATGKKIIGINHLEGHAFSSFLEHNVPFPHLCLTASGGHTSLYTINGFGDYTVTGQTIDDAAGEAFDKIAKLLELPYPGGPHIEKQAQLAECKDYYHYPRGNPHTLDFSFSGLKTAVLYDLVNRGLYDLKARAFTTAIAPEELQRIASSLLVCIGDIFTHKISLALKQNNALKAVTFVGGVACNKYLKNHLRAFCEQRGLQFYTPAAQYCTDNAAMIAFVGNYKAQQGHFANLDLDIFK